MRQGLLRAPLLKSSVLIWMCSLKGIFSAQTRPLEAELMMPPGQPGTHWREKTNKVVEKEFKGPPTDTALGSSGDSSLPLGQGRWRGCEPVPAATWRGLPLLSWCLHAALNGHLKTSHSHSQALDVLLAWRGGCQNPPALLFSVAEAVPPPVDRRKLTHLAHLGNEQRKKAF